MSKCNTENEKLWLQDALALFCTWSPLPKGSKHSGTRFNAITRMIMYTTIVLLLMKFKYWYIFLIGSVALLVVMYLKATKEATKEHFAFLSSTSVKMTEPSVIYNDFSNGQRLVKPQYQYNFNQQVEQLRSKDAYNQLRLMPIDTQNVSNTYQGYEDRVMNTKKEAGKRDSEAGVQYYTPYVGVNPKTNIPPVIGPRITDQDYWGKQSTVVHGVNKLHIVDVTNEAIDQMDMKPDYYPNADGYKYGYPLAIPVKYDNRVPNGVWEMNPVGQDPDIGYYPSQMNQYNAQNFGDYNRDTLPLYTNEKSYVVPNIDMKDIYNAGTQPFYRPWDQPNTSDYPSVRYQGITQDMADAQMGAVCNSCNPQLASQPSTAPKEGFSFVDIDGGRAKFAPDLDKYASQPPPQPLPNQYGGNPGGRGVFADTQPMMNRVPPGQNVQIPAVTSQLMYASPAYNYTDSYFNSPNTKLFLQDIQPSLYSYSVDQTPINNNVGISYAPQKPPRVLDQVTANGMSMPLYSRVDPQLVRTDGTVGQQARQPTRSNWSSEYSNFQPAPGSINFEDIYDPRFTTYGDPYRGYSDVNLGQVQYYYADVQAYREPNFITRSNVDFVDFRNPNGQIWPYYERNASLDETRSHVENQVTADELYHREDLMSLQMDKINRERWQTRFAPLNNNNSFH